MTHPTDTTRPSKKHGHKHGKPALMLIASVLFGAVLALWGWNTIAAGLLGAPEARFVHALALEAALLGLTLPFVAWSRLHTTTL